MQRPSFFTLAALSLALAAPLVPAFAQTPPTTAPVREHGGGRLKKMADELGLTDAQKAQLKPILMSARQQAKAIKENTALSDADRKAQLKALAKSTRQQMLPILTPAQRAQLKSINQARRQAKNAA